jgi:hypothetical protein
MIIVFSTVHTRLLQRRLHPCPHLSLHASSSDTSVAKARSSTGGRGAPGGGALVRTMVQNERQIGQWTWRSPTERLLKSSRWAIGEPRRLPSAPEKGSSAADGRHQTSDMATATHDLFLNFRSFCERVLVRSNPRQKSYADQGSWASLRRGGVFLFLYFPYQSTHDERI